MPHLVECDDCPFERDIDNIRKILYGNGDEGLPARLVRMEERISQIREDLLELKEKEFRQMETKLRWSIAVYASIASIVGSIMVRFLTEVWR